MAALLKYYEAGPEDGPMILIIHGWTMSASEEMHDLEPILDESMYRRIYVDLPGMGRSPATSAINDLESMLQSVVDLVEDKILPSRFILTGSSCGAYIARALAYKYSANIDGILLRVPLAEPESAKRDIDRPFIPAISDSALLGNLADGVRGALGDIPVQTTKYITELIKKSQEVWKPAVAASDAAVLDVIRNDPIKYRLTSRMHSSREPFLKPTLIVSGRHDSDVGYRDAWKLVGVYKRATFVVLDRASHGFPVDESERIVFKALVKDWLRRVQETRDQ